MPILGPKEPSRSLKKAKQWSLTRDFLKQYLTNKQNGYFQSGRLRKEVAYDKLSIEESCTNNLSSLDVRIN